MYVTDFNTGVLKMDASGTEVAKFGYSDGGTFIRLSAQNNKGIKMTNDSDVGVVVADSGNVNIGNGSQAITLTINATSTATPSFDMDVAGTANISAGLIVDTDTLTVDQSTNRVGIRTTTPQKEFSVVGDVQVTGSMFIDASTNEIAGEFVVEGAVGIYTANVSGGTI